MNKLLAWRLLHPRLLILSVLFVGLVACILAFIGYEILDPFRLDYTRRDVASGDVRLLLQTCRAYRLANDDFPSSLQQLAIHQPPYIKKDNLLDPWKRPYLYQYPGQHNNQGEPDIYSLGPDPSDTKGMIGSWMAWQH